MTDTPADHGPADGIDTPVTLSRRDAIAALTAAGAATTLAGALSWDRLISGAGDDADDNEGFDEAQRETLVALADHLYPSAVTGVAEFVEGYAAGRVRDRPEYADGMADSLDTLETYAREWTGERFADLQADRRGTLLNSMGVTVASPDPEGLDPERVRFYLVNELLFALYASPTGGQLVGIENPQGHPGGATSYRQPPQR